MTLSGIGVLSKAAQNPIPDRIFDYMAGNWTESSDSGGETVTNLS